MFNGADDSKVRVKLWSTPSFSQETFMAAFKRSCYQDDLGFQDLPQTKTRPAFRPDAFWGLGGDLKGSRYSNLALVGMRSLLHD